MRNIVINSQGLPEQWGQENVAKHIQHGASRIADPSAWCCHPLMLLLGLAFVAHGHMSDTLCVSCLGEASLVETADRSVPASLYHVYVSLPLLQRTTAHCQARCKVSNAQQDSKVLHSQKIKVS